MRQRQAPLDHQVIGGDLGLGIGWGGVEVERRSGGKEEVKVLTKAGLSCCHLF